MSSFPSVTLATVAVSGLVDDPRPSKGDKAASEDDSESEFESFRSERSCSWSCRKQHTLEMVQAGSAVAAAVIALEATAAAATALATAEKAICY